MRWVERQGVRWLEAELPGARAAFTTRLGGVSDEPFDELNLGLQTDDRPADVAENRSRLAATFGFETGQVLSARQVHGAELQFHSSPQDRAPFAATQPPASVASGETQGPDPLPVADGQVTASTGLAPLVLVADCLPVALIGPGQNQRPCLAMLHCGWRPLAAGIVDAGAKATGVGLPGGISAAAIGPGIGPCCFEVGPEVLEAFNHLGPGISQGRMLDLPEVAERLLRRAGVQEVERSGHCTRCEPQLFYSHRRDGAAAGRQAGLAWLEARGSSQPAA